jgi:integrative and conjugative element protein (TIGR02256 family)
MQAWIRHDVLNRIQQEASDKAPLETGGVLAGYFSADDRNVVITEMVGPGPKAKHEKCTYIPDYSYHREEVGRIFDASNGFISYLGDWHSHPDSMAYMSYRDKQALLNIAQFKFNYVNRPVMLILGGTCNGIENIWNPKLWRILRNKHKILWGKWDYIPFEIIKF